MRYNASRNTQDSDYPIGIEVIYRLWIHLEVEADSLRERILSGEFKEGDPLVQEAIAEEYEVSRMPVREALRLLEASGLVAMKTHKGAIVTSIPTEQIGELFELRALLECEILGQSIPRMTDDHLVNSQSILTQLEDAYHRRDVHSWGGLNWEFHRSLYVSAQRVRHFPLFKASTSRRIDT